MTLSRLEPAQAEAFLKDARAAPLSTYESLAEESASILSDSTSDWLCLDGLQDLSEEHAQCLSHFSGSLLSLNGIGTLTEHVAEALSNFSGALHLNAVRDVSPEIARILSHHNGPLYLDGLRALSQESAGSLMLLPEIHLRLSKNPSGRTADLLKQVAKSNGFVCRTSHKANEGLIVTRHGWPAPMPRRDFYIENDDPASWVMSSAIYQAMGGRESMEDIRNGWCMRWEVEEINDVRFILEDGLTQPEQRATLASGVWPLLRIPDGVLLVGIIPFRGAKLGVSTDDTFEVRIIYHDRCVIVRVPPGCYSVGIHQHFNSCYTFSLHKYDCHCSWDPALVRNTPSAHADCPDYLPLTPAPGVQGWNSDSVNAPSELNYLGTAMGIRHCVSPPQPSGYHSRMKLKQYTSALYCHVDETNKGWTQPLADF